MRQQLNIKLKETAATPDAPYWGDVAANRGPYVEKFIPAVNEIFKKYGISFIATREYKQQHADWSSDEIRSGLNRVYRLVLQRDQHVPQQMVSEISVLPVVEEVSPAHMGEYEITPGISQQLSRTTDQESRDSIYLSEAHHYSKGDPHITVAVLDTGINLDHPELKHALLDGYDFVNIIDGAEQFIGDYLGADAIAEDEVGHGTHVAGIIGGKGMAMPVGVAPRCKILPVRVLAAMKRGQKVIGAGLVENINNGLKWAIDNGAEVVNMSLGVPHTGGGLPHKEVIEYARAKGVTVIAAAGNDGREHLYYPGAFESVIAVGAFDRNGEAAIFSTYGKQVSLLAPGQQIYSTHINNSYGFSTGTSHAAPFVAGAVALMKSFARSKHKNLNDKQVKHILKHSSDKIDQRFKHKRAGFGRLNMADAMRLLDARLA